MLQKVIYIFFNLNTYVGLINIYMFSFYKISNIFLDMVKKSLMNYENFNKLFDI